MSEFNRNWNSFAEGGTTVHSSHHDDGDCGFCNHGDRGQWPMQAARPRDSDPFSALKLSPQPASNGQGGGIETGHFIPYNSSCIYANLTRDGRPSSYSYQIQSSSPTQAARCVINQTGIYLDLDPEYPQYPIRQEQQPGSFFQSREFYPNHKTDNLATSLIPPHCLPARGGRKRGNEVNFTSRGLQECYICGIGFKRQADLYRHLKTARAHRFPRGPVCSELGCKYTARFTRVDNFRAHYRRAHGKSNDEVNRFIQEWRDQGSP